MYRYRDPLELAFDDQLTPDDSLEVANKQVGFPELEEFAHDDQAIAGDDRFAKANFVESTEADHRIPKKFVFVSAIAANLSDCFKHHDSWH